MIISIDVYKNNQWKKCALSLSQMKALVVACANAIGVKTKSILLNVCFVGTTEMIDYNTRYRGKNCDTNVLSFSNVEKPIYTNSDSFETIILGDMVLCFDKIKQESVDYNKPFEDRLRHLFVHSTLHLFGYDHILDNDRVEMEALEEKILLP